MHIAVTGYAGLGGAKLIYECDALREKILKRYTERFLRPLKESGPLLRDLKVPKEAEAYTADGADGGVLAALFRLLRSHGLGGYYSLGLIPVTQQTIEIAELTGVNPYRLYSPGLRVWLTDGESAVTADEIRALSEAEGTAFSLIGHTAKGPGIIRLDSKTASSLRRPGEDELHRIICHQGDGIDV